MKPVTVVILNWNGKSWLEAFLPSVLASTYAQFEVLLVDNASTDDSVSWLKQHFPQIRLLELSENFGFAEGNNRAVPHIHTPYFVLLNSDVEVSPGWLEPLVARMESEPKLASVQPRIRAHHDRDSFEYAGAAGGWMDWLAYPFCRGRLFDTLEKDQGQYESAQEVFWATGACCLIRTEVVKSLGLFQAEFFAHMEEIDFCWRAKNHGFQIWCEPASVVYHVGGGALPRGNPRKTYLNARNSLLCMWLNLPRKQRIPKLLLRMLLDGVWATRALFQADWGTLKAIFKAHGYLYRKAGFWHRRRREIYGTKSIPVAQAGYYPRSIVWQYFIRGKKRFSELPGISATNS